MLRTTVTGLPGAHAESRQPKALLKQHRYFGDTFKGKFPVSTVYEATGPQRRRNLLPQSLVTLRMLFPHTEVGLLASARQALPPAAIRLQRRLSRLRF